MSSEKTETANEVDVWERTKGHTGPVQAMNKRLFMQLQVFECAPGDVPKSTTDKVYQALVKRDANCVIYEDVSNPYGLGVLTWSLDPADFVNKVRPAFGDIASCKLSIRPEFTMLGRTYTTGYEPDLEFWLLDRPVDTVCNTAWPWAIWYPLRRSGAFMQLPPKEQGAILREHGDIGKAYGAQDLAHDVRLACHGLDPNDNEFVIGLLGKELHPLSHVIQRMRSTRQTSEYISKMGPFFVGRAIASHRS